MELGHALSVPEFLILFFSMHFTYMPRKFSLEAEGTRGGGGRSLCLFYCKYSQGLSIVRESSESYAIIIDADRKNSNEAQMLSHRIADK
jgi:hypothetical protein